MKCLVDGQILSTPEIHRGIGVTFKRIFEELVLRGNCIEWFITVQSLSELRQLNPTVRKFIKPITIGECLNHGDYTQKTKYYSQLLNKVVTELEIDSYWVPNPLMMNVILPTDVCNTNIFVTVYDLIPLVMPECYISKWSEEIKNEYKHRIEKLPSWADKLIFISESAKTDFEKIDNRISSKSTVIPLAVDSTKFWQYTSPLYKPQEPYILFTGGFDPRKNMDGALEAFSYLIKTNYQEFANLKFYVVCACNDEARNKYEKLATKLGVLDNLVLTGYVEEERLITLYRGASVFFFPSHYEGFGLPVLEALACGVPVVTSKVSSIPEIAINLAYYCSPDDPKDMALALKKALHDRANNQSKPREYIQRAKEFTWSKTAASYFKLFTNTLFYVNNLVTNLEGLRRYKVAYVSPWLPQRSGIANHSYEIVRYLKQYVDINLFAGNERECNNADTFKLPIKNISALPEEISNYDCIIYHVGNNTKFHKEIYQMAWQYPGIVVLHELNIHPFMADAFLNTEDEYLYADALKEGYGEEGLSIYHKLKSKGICPDIWKFPLSNALAKRSLATIVHSQWVKGQLQDQDIDNVFVIPLGCVDRALVNEKEDDVIALRKRFNIPERKFIVSTFGFVNILKRIPIILDAIQILVDKGYPVHLFIGGHLIDTTLKIEEKIDSLGIANNVTISGYLSDREFDHYIKSSDIVLNLRYPSMGESSAALMKAFTYGKACIVTDYQQFGELPNSVCWKVDIGDLEIPILVAYLEELMRNPAARNQLGKNAAFFATNYSSYENSGKLYAVTVNKVMQMNQISEQKSVISSLI